MQRLILILVALSLGGVLTALVFLFGRYSVIPPEHLDLSNFDWGGLGTIAAFLTFFINIVLLLTVFFGFQSIREGQAARTAQVLVWATSQMDAIKEDERRLAAAPEDISDWDRQQTLSARRVTNAYQRLSYFCAHGLIPEAHIRNMWGLNLVYNWRRLKQMIDEDRTKAGDSRQNPQIRREFEATADRFAAHFEKHNPTLLTGFVKNRTALARGFEDGETRS